MCVCAQIWPWPPLPPNHICPSKIIIHISLNGVTEKAGETRTNTRKWMKSVNRTVLSDLPEESLCLGCSLCVVIYLEHINNWWNALVWSDVVSFRPRVGRWTVASLISGLQVSIFVPFHCPLIIRVNSKHLHQHVQPSSKWQWLLRCLQRSIDIPQHR